MDVESLKTTIVYARESHGTCSFLCPSIRVWKNSSRIVLFPVRLRAHLAKIIDYNLDYFIKSIIWIIIVNLHNP